MSWLGSFYILYCSSPEGNRGQAISAECKTDLVNFTDWITFAISNLMEKIILNPKVLSANIKTYEHEITMTKKGKSDLGINILI